MYSVLRPSRSEHVRVRDVQYHLRRWGLPQAAPADQPPLFMLHGYMDVSASWQFIVDALQHERQIIAPDWRGFGLTRPARLPHDAPAGDYGDTDHYVFADYLADLECLIEHVNAELGRPPEAPVDLVAHSMGANASLMYAGARPQRVRRLVSLDGFGMPANPPSQAPKRLSHWIDDLKALYRGEKDLAPYDSADAVARRLMKTNPLLPEARALWLARHWAAEQADGRWTILGHAAHKLGSAQLYRLEEVLALFGAIAAPVLAVEAELDSLGLWYPGGEHSRAEYHRRLQHIPHCRTAVVAQAGHMLHHDQPAAVARLIEDFLN